MPQQLTAEQQESIKATAKVAVEHMFSGDGVGAIDWSKFKDLLNNPLVKAVARQIVLALLDQLLGADDQPIMNPSEET